MSEPAEVTRLLRSSREGDAAAMDRLVSIVYPELHRLAARAMRREGSDHTLQTTAVLHEAYLRLVEVDVAWHDRLHFFATAARVIRRVLVDHARARRREKRGGGLVAVTLDDALAAAPEPAVDVLALDEALNRLAERDERTARVVELHYFGGMTYEETASALGISAATVDRELRLAKAWLRRELDQEGC